MKLNIELLKQHIGESRTKADALKVLQMLSDMFSGSGIKPNTTYYVSEWSWTPLTDGNFPCLEPISNKSTINGVEVFSTGGCRTYFSWDLFETKEQCEKMCKFKNSFGYEWEMAVSDFKKAKELFRENKIIHLILY